MPQPIIYVLVLIASFTLVMGLGVFFIVFKNYKRVKQGEALIVNKMGNKPAVSFTGALVLPIIHLAEVMDISMRTVEISYSGSQGIICQDNIRADIKVTFFFRVNPTAEDILKVAQSLGCARASDQRTLDELFGAKFSDALKTAAKQLNFEELYTKRELFKDEIIMVIGQDLNGFVLEDLTIDFLEQTPIEKLDPNNILDAQGIRKIKAATQAAAQHPYR